MDIEPFTREELERDNARQLEAIARIISRLAEIEKQAKAILAEIGKMQKEISSVY